MSAVRRWWPLLLVTLAFGAAEVPKLRMEPLGRDSWRETDVLIVGRNFCEEDARIWLPRVNARGDTPGITGMEFPLLNWIAGRAACLGYNQQRVARIVTLIFSLIGLLCVGFLAGPRAAPIAAFVCATSPIVWYYAASIQPDMPSLSLMLLALMLLQYSLNREEPPLGLFLVSAFCASVAILVKLPAIVFGLPAAALMVQRFGWRRVLRMPRSWMYLIIAVVPAIIWYHVAKILQQRYGIFVFFLGKPWHELVADWMRPHFYRSVFLDKLFRIDAFPLISLIAVGMLTLGWRRCPVLLRAMAGAGLAYIFLCGHHIEHHFYYNLPLVPIIALAAARFVELVWDRVSLRTAALVAAPLALMMVLWGRKEASTWWALPHRGEVYREAQVVIDRVVPHDARMLLFSNNNPRVFWFLDRRGWLAPHERARDWFNDKAPRPPLIVVDVDTPDMIRQRDALVDAFRAAHYRPLRSDNDFEIWVAPSL